MESVDRAGVLLACLAAASVSGCGPQGSTTPRAAGEAPPAAEVAAEVKAAIQTQVAAYAAKDAAKAASVVAPDIVAFFHGQPDVVGKAAAESAMKAQMTLPDIALSVSDETVDVAASGDLAVYHAKYRFSFTDPQTKRPFVEVGNWVAVFKRQTDGAMRMSMDVVTDTPPPPVAQP